MDVRKWQQALKKHGFNPGKIDGIRGPKTNAAIERAKDWQKWLNRKGFAAGSVDGIPGPRTERAIINFQKAARILVDGVIGPQTWNARRKWAGVVKRKVIRPVIDRVINPVINKIAGARAWPDIAYHYTFSSHGSARVVDAWHRARGFRKGGYHVLISNEFGIEAGDEAFREIGAKIVPDHLRTLSEVGAHIYRRNIRTLGVCFVSVDGTITPKQLEDGQKVTEFCRSKGIGLNIIDGHKEFPRQATACPGVLPVAELKG